MALHCDNAVFHRCFSIEKYPQGRLPTTSYGVLKYVLLTVTRTARLHRAACDLSLLAFISLNQLSLAVRLQVKLVSRSLNRSIVEYPEGEFRYRDFLCALKGDTVRI